MVMLGYRDLLTDSNDCEKCYHQRILRVFYSMCDERAVGSRRATNPRDIRARESEVVGVLLYAYLQQASSGEWPFNSKRIHRGRVRESASNGDAFVFGVEEEFIF